MRKNFPMPPPESLKLRKLLKLPRASSVRHVASGALIAALLLFAFPSVLLAQEGAVIRKITVTGTITMTPESVLFYTDFKEGERFDEEQARKEYRRLWQSGLFRSLSMEVHEVEDGVELVIAVQEKPVLRSVTYKGAKRLSETRIKEGLKQNGVEFKEGGPLDRAAVRRAEAILTALLESRGYKYAEVTSEIDDVGDAEVTLTFHMDQGARVKVKRIAFKGNKAFSSRRLKRQMKKFKEAGLYNSLRRRHIFSEAKFYENLQGVVDFYKDRGYVTMTLDEPVVDVRNLAPEGKKPKQRAFVTIVVKEGLRYRVGEISFKGNTVFSTGELRPLMKLKRGDLYRHKEVQKARKEVDTKYGEKGYIFSQSGVIPKTNEKTQIVDLVFDIEEGKPYFLHRLEFRGNTSTHDRVLRREFMLSEGDLFNMRHFDRSMRKVSQLGFFKITEPPAITPVEDAENQVNTLVVGEEDKRNMFEFGGGYSGLEGGFIQSSYSTRNFLGRGEVLEFMARLGGRTDSYSISFTEPWLFDRPYTGGISLFRVDQRFVQFDQRSTGGSLVFGVPVTYFSRAFIRYSYQETTLKIRTGSIVPLLSDLDKTRIVQVSPSFIYDSRNHFYAPSKGTRFMASLPVSHWRFGSDVSYYKFLTQYTHYFPAFRRTYFAANAEFGFVRPFANHRIPTNERFFLGGASSIRGYEVRSVGPAFQGLIYGGDTYLQANAEYVIPVGGTFQFALFADAGDAYTLRPIRTVFNGNIETLRKKLDFSMPSSVGVEVRFFMPTFPFPVRLIWSRALNPEPWQRTRTFEFNIGAGF
jgi:outer membrane protein insertion porin family